MQYAIIDNSKVRPIKGRVGFCPLCGAQMIARCGKIKIHHWSHKGKLHCDRWWESETEWHRGWKNHFPAEWQEIVHFDDNGEKHIADLKTPHGLVVEFQHSHISPKEKLARENFYKNIIWVVDGNRRKKDWIRFNEGFKEFIISPVKDTYLVPMPSKSFSEDWIYSNTIVVFDFDSDNKGLNCVFMLYRPKKASHFQCTLFNKSVFISLISSGELLNLINEQNEDVNLPKSRPAKSSQIIFHRGKPYKKRRL